MFAYVFKKLANNFFARYTAVRVQPLLRIFNNIQSSPEGFFFDFSDETTHLGDRLFFIPLIDQLLKSGYSVRLSESDDVTNTLIVNILQSPPLEKVMPLSTDIVVYPMPSYLNFRGRYKNSLIVDFTDATTERKIAEQLIISFKLLFRLRIAPCGFISENITASSSDYLIPESRYIVFSNYIHSGGFRKFFVDNDRLNAAAVAMRANGYKILHVGSPADALNDSTYYSFVDIDLRGKLSIEQLIKLISSKNVVGAVTYDNFIMHLFGLNGKPATVLFRGRLLKKNSDHHFKYINNTFFQDQGLLTYL